jgi:hypothetical protein
MKISNEEIKGEEYLGFCEKCRENTVFKTLEQYPVEVPPGEIYSKSECTVCKEIVEELSLHVTVESSDDDNERG